MCHRFTSKKYEKRRSCMQYIFFKNHNLFTTDMSVNYGQPICLFLLGTDHSLMCWMPLSVYRGGG